MIMWDMASRTLFVKRVTCLQRRARWSAFKKQAIKKSVEVLSYYSVSIPKGFLLAHPLRQRHDHGTRGQGNTRPVHTLLCCTACVHCFKLHRWCLSEREQHFSFKKRNLKKKKYICLSFFKAKFLQLQLNWQKLQLQQLFVAISTCFTVTLQTVVNIAERPLHYIRQHGLYFEEFCFFSTKHTVSVSRVVYYVSITQGQTRSSSFRTRAVSAFTAHRLISLMQSKHVINGPSQPPLFVVRQTLKSNVSTMGGKKICWHGRSADVRYFSHAEKSFILLLFFFFDSAWKGRFFCSN